MRKTIAIVFAILLLSSTMIALLGFPPTANAVDFTPTPLAIRSNTNIKESVSICASDDGRIYVVWSETTGGNYDILFNYSSNNGTTFYTPTRRVNQNAAGNQKASQAATANNTLYVVWQDALNDGGDIVMASSTDGGSTFQEIHVSDYDYGTQTNPTIAASGNRVAVAWEESRSDNTIRIWDGDTGTAIRNITGHQGAVKSVEFSPDGTQIASGSEDRTVKIWNASTGALLNNLTHHTREINTVGWSPDGKMLATGSWDYNVTLLSTADFSIMTKLNSTNGNLTKNTPNAISFSPDSAYLAVAFNGGYGTVTPTGLPVQDYNITVWNLTDHSSWTRNELTPAPNKGHTNSVYDIAYSHNGTYVASASKDGKVKIWNASDGKLVKDVAMAQQALSVSWSPDDRFMAVGLGNGSIALVNFSNTADRTWLKDKHIGTVRSLDWCEVNDELVSGASEPIARIWYNRTSPQFPDARENLTGHINSVYSVDWSPDGKRALTAGGNSIYMGESQIFCAVSEDGGTTFSPPTLVVDNFARRFAPKIALGPAGTVSVVWYDSRDGVDHIYFANSTDGGASFGRNIGVDTLSNSCVTPNIFVDVSGIAHVVWQHGEYVTIPPNPVPTFIPGRTIRYANSSDNFASSRVIATGNHTQVPRIAGAPGGSSFWVTWRFKNTTTNQYHFKAATSYDGGTTFNYESQSINYSSSSINNPTIFVDRYNQTFVAWELNYILYFRTTVLSDEWPPRILSTTPWNSQTDVSVFTYITIRFSEPMNKVATEAAFSWTDGTTTWYVGNCTNNGGIWNSYSDIVSFQPKSEFRPKYDASYTFRIAHTASDISGNILGYNLSVTFSTSLDMDPPIIEHYPGQTKISYNEEYTVMALIYDQWGAVDYARLYYQGVADSAPMAFVEMTLTDTDTYQATIPAQHSLGTIYYYLTAADTSISGNKAWSPVNYTDQSQLYNVSVIDGVGPEIFHAPIVEADVFTDIVIRAVVTDEIQLMNVSLNCRVIGSPAYENYPMIPVSNAANTFSYTVPAQVSIGMIHYNIAATDAAGNFNATTFNSVQILDKTAPVINSVIPELLDNQTRVLVRANVTDDVGVGSVVLYFKSVGGDDWVRRDMSYVSDDMYEFIIPAQRRSGTIFFYVNATDTSGNQASTLLEQDKFQIEVEGVGADYTMYYLLGGVFMILMILFVILLVRKFSKPKPESEQENAPEEPPISEESQTDPEDIVEEDEDAP